MEEQGVLEAARQYGELARELRVAEQAQGSDCIRNALLRLYHGIQLSEQVAKCREKLTEDTPEQTVDAVMDAEQTVRLVTEGLFGYTQDCIAKDKKLEKRIAAMTLSSPKDDLDDLLFTLYKCEDIIRQIYRCATRYPVYGLQRSLFGGAADTEPIMNTEAFIADEMDVDISALREVRGKLIAAIDPLVRNMQ